MSALHCERFIMLSVLKCDTQTKARLKWLVISQLIVMLGTFERMCRAVGATHKSERAQDLTILKIWLYWFYSVFPICFDIRNDSTSLHPLYYLSVAWQSKFLNTFFLHILYSKKVYDFRCSLCVSMSHIRKLKCIQQAIFAA